MSPHVFRWCLALTSIAAIATAKDNEPAPAPHVVWPVQMDQRTMPRTVVQFPSVEGFEVLAGDFHCHTIYSDGQVTAEVRIWEAWRDGLDILSLTDHPEYIDTAFPEDRARAYGRAKLLAAELGLILVPGVEMTTVRSTLPPFSDFVVNFVTDESALKGDFMTAARAARAQGATFVLAHPGTGWTKEAAWLLEQGWLDGIELHNAETAGSSNTRYQPGVPVSFYPQAMEWCMKHNLAPFADSDAHWPADHYYHNLSDGEHRDMTLVLAQSRDLAAVKDAIRQRRVIAYFGETLWGAERWVKGLAEGSIEFSRVALIRPKEKVYGVFVTNHSTFPFQAAFSAADTEAWFRPVLITLAPRATTMVPFTLRDKTKTSFPAELKLTNVFTAVDRPLEITRTVSLHPHADEGVSLGLP